MQGVPAIKFQVGSIQREREILGVTLGGTV